MSQIRYRFVPGQASDVPSLLRFVNDSLRRLADAMTLVETPVVPTLAQPPQTPVQGQLAIADGSGWNPGQGAGTYIYRDNAWRRID